MFNKSKGYTLFELMLVVGLMTVISIGVLIERRNEALQLQAKVLGAEIAEFARGLNSYVSYHAAISPTTPGSPSHGASFNGVNWLKSSDCIAPNAAGTYPSSSAGSLQVGFISNCSYLSRVKKNSKSPAANDQTTSFRNLKFHTTFYRALWPGFSAGTAPVNPAYAITDLTPLIDDKGLNMHALSGLAATVANGYGVSDRDGGHSFRVIYCMTSSGANPLVNAVCTGRVGKIIVFSSNDPRSDVWLRTDGSNTMNAEITFNDSLLPDVQAIVNLGRMALTGGNLKLESASDASKFVELHVGDPTWGNNSLVVESANFGVRDGNILTNKEVHADGNIESKADVKGRRFVDLDDQNFLADPNGLSKMNSIDVRDTLRFDGASAGSQPQMKVEGGRDLALTSDGFKFGTNKGADPHTDLKGRVDVSNLMVKMSSGADKSLASLLPRMRLLDTVMLTDYSYRGETVPISHFTSMGCTSGNLRPIVTPSYVNYAASIDLRVSAYGVLNTYNGNAKTDIYTLDYNNRGQNRAIGALDMKVVQVGSSYGIRIRSVSGREDNSNRYGAGLLSVYCVQQVSGG
ncbi:type II secretion system protein [Vibrio owensii]|uniref:type II secretion system protein n=1 Tax=Vibrio owensii TaxID=696485 RepID=UPI003CC59BD8